MVCKVDLDSTYTEFIGETPASVKGATDRANPLPSPSAADKYDCQYRPTYFYIKDGEVVGTTIGDTETTVEAVTHWAKHGCKHPTLVETKVPDFMNPEAGDDDDDDEPAADKPAADAPEGGDE